MRITFFLVALLLLGVRADDDDDHRRPHGRDSHGHESDKGHGHDGVKWKCIHDVFQFVEAACPALRGAVDDTTQACLRNHKAMFAEECGAVVDAIVEGLDVCMEDTSSFCPVSSWGMNKEYQTPMACLKANHDVLTPACKQAAFMHTCERHGKYRSWGRWYGKWDDASEGHRQRSCKLWFWGLVAIVSTIALCWTIRERRRRRAMRMLRWTATGAVPQGSETWTTGLFGNWTKWMPDWRTCLPSCLPCFLPFQIAFNAAETRDRDLHSCDVCCSLNGWSRLTNMWRTRQEIRSKYDFPEAQCEDCLAVTCCGPCSVAQHARELDARAGVGQGTTAAQAIAMPTPMQMVGIAEPLTAEFKTVV